jgi:hypothetical protein
VLAFGGAALGAAVSLARGQLPALVSRRSGGGYGALLRDACFLRYALSQAFTLGGLLVFVFGSPSVFVTCLGGTLADFITMQISGIATFALAANVAGRLSHHVGAERLIVGGTALSAAGAGSLLAYAALGGTQTPIVTLLFVPFNLGLGLRGPPGFHRAVVAARGDDARGAALVVIAVLASTAAGTALVAPFIMHGLVPLTLAAFVLAAASLGLLWGLPPLSSPPPDPS